MSESSSSHKPTSDCSSALILATNFLCQSLGETPLLIKGNCQSWFQTLFPASDLNDLVALADRLPPEAVELIGRTSSTSHRGLRDFFNAGSTIRIRGIQKFSLPLADLCRELQERFGAPARVNLYCTPPNARGLELHSDKHDVWIQQLRGRKRWQVYEPLSGTSLDSSDAARPGAKVVEAVLEPGDSLYLPHGFVHQAEALDEVSIHLTIGLHVQSVLEREQLPTINVTEPVRAASVNSGTELEAESDLRLYVSADGLLTALARGERTFWMPSAFAATLRFVAEHNLFRPSELPQITERGRLALVRLLLENGFVRVAR